MIKVKDTIFLEDKDVEDQKDNKGTWNQASRIQVRGGLLGYEDQSTSGSSKYYCVKVLLKVKVLLMHGEYSKYF